MKKKTTISISLLLLFVISGLSSMVSVAANDTTDLQPYDAGSKIRESSYQIMNKPHHRHREKLLTGQYYEVGAIIDWAILDDYEGAYYYALYELRAMGPDCEIWVQVDLSYPDEDPRDDPIVTDEQVEYLLDEFEGNIYPIDTEYFGVPDFLDGTKASLGKDYIDPSGRSVILVSNVRDESYYNDTYPYYIAGFYSPTFEIFFDRNIISIDCHNWEDRVGPGVPRPFLYEAIIAHEYQHLIHDDYNMEDELFMNEGCSMYAEPLCGYPLAWGDIESFLFTPDNSLTDWGDQGGINILADYGSSLMWTVYLSDNYGGADLISHFVKTGIPGIEGINAALEEFGYTDTFEEVFHDWRIANLIHSEDYDYSFMDLGDTDPTRIYDLDETSIFPMNGVDFGETITILDHATGVYELGSYSTDYIKLTGLNDFTFSFDGDDFGTAASWVIDEGVLYSTPAWSECDLSIIVDLDLTDVEDATLSYDTKYQIEIDWDFGFTQVSTDGGVTWVSLENENTTDVRDPGAYPAIVENLPGLSGESDWGNIEFDLSPYDGQEIMLQFRYMTDWAYEELGWWIQNVAVNGEIIPVEEFYFPPPPETDFIVSLIGSNGAVVDLVLDDATETGSLALWEEFAVDQFIYLVVSAIKGNVDYELNFYQDPS